MEESSSLTLIMVLLGISIPVFTTVGLFMIKSSVDLRKCISKLSERIAILETKANIFHPE